MLTFRLHSENKILCYQAKLILKQFGNDFDHVHFITLVRILQELNQKYYRSHITDFKI